MFPIVTDNHQNPNLSTPPSPHPHSGLRAQLQSLLPKHALFYAKIEIHQISSVPLVHGEFAVRWKFKHAQNKMAVRKIVKSRVQASQRKNHDHQHDDHNDHNSNNNSDSGSGGHGNSGTTPIPSVIVSDVALADHTAVYSSSTPSQATSASSSAVVFSPSPSPAPVISRASSSAATSTTSTSTESGGVGGASASASVDLTQFLRSDLSTQSYSNLTSSTPTSHYSSTSTGIASSSSASRPTLSSSSTTATTATTTTTTTTNATPSSHHPSTIPITIPSSSSIYTPSKGITPFNKLHEHSVNWNQVLHTILKIPIDRETHVLEPSLLKLVVTQRVVHGDPDAPKQPRLGAVYLDLSEYAGVGKEVERRYLLAECRVNVVIKLTTHLIPLTPDISYTSPPLPKAEILNGVEDLLHTDIDIYHTRPRGLDLWGPFHELEKERERERERAREKARAETRTRTREEGKERTERTERNGRSRTSDRAGKVQGTRGGGGEKTNHDRNNLDVGVNGSPNSKGKKKVRIARENGDDDDGRGRSKSRSRSRSRWGKKTFGLGFGFGDDEEFTDSEEEEEDEEDEEEDDGSCYSSLGEEEEHHGEDLEDHRGVEVQADEYGYGFGYGVKSSNPTAAATAMASKSPSLSSGASLASKGSSGSKGSKKGSLDMTPRDQTSRTNTKVDASNGNINGTGNVNGARFQLTNRLPLAYGPKTTELLIEALFNPVSVVDQRNSKGGGATGFGPFSSSPELGLGLGLGPEFGFDLAGEGVMVNGGLDLGLVDDKSRLDRNKTIRSPRREYPALPIGGASSSPRPSLDSQVQAQTHIQGQGQGQGQAGVERATTICSTKSKSSSVASRSTSNSNSSSCAASARSVSLGSSLGEEGEREGSSEHSHGHGHGHREEHEHERERKARWWWGISRKKDTLGGSGSRPGTPASVHGYGHEHGDETVVINKTAVVGEGAGGGGGGIRSGLGHAGVVGGTVGLVRLESASVTTAPGSGPRSRPGTGHGIVQQGSDITPTASNLTSGAVPQLAVQQQQPRSSNASPLNNQVHLPFFPGDGVVGHGIGRPAMPRMSSSRPGTPSGGVGGGRRRAFHHEVGESISVGNIEV